MKRRVQDPLRGIAGEAFWVLGSTTVIALAGVGLNVLIGNLFGSGGLGVYTLFMTVYLAAGTLASLGLPGAVTKFATEHRFLPELERRYLSSALILSLAGSLAVCLLLLVFRDSLAGILRTPRLSVLIGISVAGIPLFAVNKMILARIRGLRRIRNFAIGESWRVILIVGVTLLLVMVRRTLVAAAAALVVSEGLLFVLLAWAGKIYAKFTLSGLRKPFKHLMSYGRRILLSRFFLELDGRIAFLLGGYFLGTGPVGILSVAFLFTQGLTLLPTALIKVTGPVITELYLADRRDALTNFIRNTIGITLFLLAGTALVLWWGFHPLIAVLYPGKPLFQQAFVPFGILAVGLVLRGGVGAVGSVFVSMGRPDIVMKLSPIRLLINITASLALVSPFGLSGIAAGTSVTGVAVFLLWVFAMRKAEEIRIRAVRLCLLPFFALLLAVISSFLSGRFPSWLVYPVALALYGLAGYVFLGIREYFVRLSSSHALHGSVGSGGKEEA
ncbi:MAG: oligosaccharide flippase family protein [Deltaproteobacteria bacterium]|nr:oligosaccharide flippase family protein [Deltaproteobacteria bacterium]